MYNKLIDIIKKDDDNWTKYQNSFIERKYSSKTVLLPEGEVSKHIHFIKQGCLRMWFNKDGKDITVQFFFEGQAVASIDSFMSDLPSLFTIECIEPSTILSLSKNDFQRLSIDCPEFKDAVQDLIYKRFRNYALLFLSRIKDTPKERYEELIKNNPEIFKRIPQHYIASYLGITPVSLSRIRNRR